MRSFKIRKVITVFTMLVMLISFNTLIYAADVTETTQGYVSQEEILTQLEVLSQKYDVEIEYMGQKGSKRYTKEEVEEELAILEGTFKSIEDVEVTDTNRVISPMFAYDRTYKKAVLCMNLPAGGATIEISCKASINDSTISFIDIYDIKTRQYGYSANFISWEQNSSSYSYSNQKKEARVIAYGTLVIEMDLNGQGFRVTKDHDIPFDISA